MAVVDPAALSNKELKAWISKISNNVGRWRRLFAAALPEIRRRKIWLKEGFADIYHYSSVKVSFNKKLVTRILNIFDSIEKFSSLKILFTKGTVGWAKFEIVAPVLNNSNCKYFAERLQQDTSDVLDKIVKKIKARREGEQTSRDETSLASRLATAPAPATATAPATGTPALELSLDTLPNSKVYANTKEAYQSSLTYSSSPSLKPIAEQSPIFEMNTLFEIAAHQSRESRPCLACGHVPGDRVRKRGGREQDALYADPVIIEIFHRFLTHWQQKDKTKRMSDVLERVALFAMHKGIDFPAPELPEMQQESPSSEDASPKDSNASPKDSNVSGKGEDVSGKGEDVSGKGEDGSNKNSPKTFDWTKKSRWHERPYVQIIYYDVKTGACLTPTYKGRLPVDQSELENRPAIDESPIDLEKLRIQMKEYAAKYMERCRANGVDPGGYIPLPIQKYIFLRSGGICEFPGCNERAERFHHAKRKSVDPDCDPDGIPHVGLGCHNLFHASAVANELGPFDEFEIRLESQDGSEGEDERNRVDRQFREARDRAVNGDYVGLDDDCDAAADATAAAEGGGDADAADAADAAAAAAEGGGENDSHNDGTVDADNRGGNGGSNNRDNSNGSINIASKDKESETEEDDAEEYRESVKICLGN